MTTRRYGDDEAREIFGLATTGETRDRLLPTETGGLTLPALEQIAQGVGIEPARVALAAAALDARGNSLPCGGRSDSRSAFRASPTFRARLPIASGSN